MTSPVIRPAADATDVSTPQVSRPQQPCIEALPASLAGSLGAFADDLAAAADELPAGADVPERAMLGWPLALVLSVMAYGLIAALVWMFSAEVG